MNHVILSSLSIFLVLVTFNPGSATRIVQIQCNSWNYAKQVCTSTGNVLGFSLVSQRSRSSCRTAQSRGIGDDGNFFVDNGCRGTFSLSLADPTNLQIQCNSWNYAKQVCTTTGNVMGFSLVSKQSSSSCSTDQSRGIGDDGNFYVDNGCRGIFNLSTAAARTEQIQCNSWNYAKQVCTTTKNVLGFTLVSQQSRSRCTTDQSRGIQDDGNFFVDNGCRGTFRLSLAR